MTNLSTIRSVVVLFAILVTGLLAGVMLGLQWSNKPHRNSPKLRGHSGSKVTMLCFGKVMPFTFTALMLLLVASIFLLHGSSRIAMVVATIAALAVIIVTAGWEVPINNEIVKWIAGSAPVDWTGTRDKWLHYHSVRTWIGVASFAFALLSTVLVTDTAVG